MICTEKEAQRKWCPFARVVDQAGNGGNRYRMDVDKSENACFTVCVGSSCMMWQDHGTVHEEHWFPDDAEDHESKGLFGSTSFRKINGIRQRLWLRDTGISQGACGLAERDVLVETS